MHVTNKVMLFASIIYIYIYIFFFEIIYIYIYLCARSIKKSFTSFPKKKNIVIVTNYFTILLQIVGVINFY